MIIVLDKSSNQILHIYSGDLSLKLSPKQIYSGYDPKTMKLLKSGLGYIPKVFKVDKKGYMHEKTPEEKLIDGDISFEEVFDISSLINVGIANTGLTEESLSEESLTEESLSEGSNSESFDPVAFVLTHKLVDSQQKCRLVLAYLNARLENKILQQYPVGKELKIIKSYMDWRDEGKPKKDPRQTNYQTMNTNIASIKESNKLLSEFLKSLLKTVKD